MSAASRPLLVAALVVVAVAGCASTKVIRTPSGGTTTVKPSVPRYGKTVVVQRGDTMYRVASSNGIRAVDLAAWNGIPAPYTIYPGQRLRLYPSQGGSGTATTGTSGGTVATRPVPATRPPTTTPRPPTATAPAPAPQAAPVASGFNWRWPADGELIGRYVAGEPTKQGIDIAGSSGAPVRAAADGVVVYSGSGLVGYGELVIIKHNEQWLSAYGHNRNRLVNEGQLVKAGQQIAEMGRSGAPREMLHFEVRYNGKPVDPLLYLPKK
ncbi:peptidoglycan DD-metalloendopeptidase family protein [Lysobacter arenosi]|uniref:Peptidoglycan DD-metalloendopeptidase family protein n=2 Tax=Lysobacter arenosi TaxID=2795387 RepID=A0ABX7RFA0_9GAMM|nr:peptidoglycan DD-metalloendopeptidase family protein [Lysobacter arenosi]QSX76390.1 peptidoglycan DD-metalloendopeptidase family protein [Lysobacter arenosi]